MRSSSSSKWRIRPLSSAEGLRSVTGRRRDRPRPERLQQRIGAFCRARHVGVNVVMIAFEPSYSRLSRASASRKIGK